MSERNDTNEQSDQRLAALSETRAPGSARQMMKMRGTLPFDGVTCTPLCGSDPGPHGSFLFLSQTPPRAWGNAPGAGTKEPEQIGAIVRRVLQSWGGLKGARRREAPGQFREETPRMGLVAGT